MSEHSPETPPLFRTADISSTFEHIYRRPDELIGFADLLMRWPNLSFFKVPFFAVMRRVGEDIHTLAPVKPRKRRDNKLKDIRPQVAVLNRLGIRDKEKMAKIIYSLHPFLLEREIPLLVSPSPGIKTSIPESF